MNGYPPIRVLVVDDSAFMRKAISTILNEAPDITVVDTARNGEEALQKVRSGEADVMTLDVAMPGMNGLTVLERVMTDHPMPVIMVSSVTEDGAAETIKALELGAIDFIPKHLGGSSLKISEIREPLHEKVRIAAKSSLRIRQWKGKSHLSRNFPGPFQAVTGRKAEGKEAPSPDRYASMAKGRPNLLVIGCSTGGPQALQAVLTRLSSTFPSPIVVAQHMPQYFTKPFAERLNHLCSLEVREAQEGDQLGPGLVLIAPGGQHLTLQRQGTMIKVHLSDQPDHFTYRPSVDLLMESAARVSGNHVVGLVMTGMGQDGLEGARAIKRAGGRIFAEDEASCIVYGMPKAVIDHGCADRVLPLSHIARELEACFLPVGHSEKPGRMCTTAVHE